MLRRIVIPSRSAWDRCLTRRWTWCTTFYRHFYHKFECCVGRPRGGWCSPESLWKYNPEQNKDRSCDYRSVHSRHQLVGSEVHAMANNSKRNTMYLEEADVRHLPSTHTASSSWPVSHKTLVAVWYGCSRVAGDTVFFEIARGALQTEVSVGLVFVCGGYIEGVRNKLCRNIVYGAEVPQGGLQTSYPSSWSWERTFRKCMYPLYWWCRSDIVNNYSPKWRWIVLDIPR